MKKINIVGLIVSFGLFFTISSCEEFIEADPKSAIKNEQFWTTNKDADNGVSAIYDMMQKTYKEKHFYWGEFRADNWANSAQQGDNYRMINNLISPQDSELVQWDEIYRMIMRANLAIENIPNIKDYNVNLLGEAYAARAYAYFDIYRVWGKAPIFTKVVATNDAAAYIPQSPKEAVLAQVFSDLAQAEKLINVQTNRFRFSVSSLQIFKAKVLMHENRYTEAKTVLDAWMLKNVSTYKFSLVNSRTAWLDMFVQAKEVGTELIFSLRATLLEDGNNVSQHQNIFAAGIPRAVVSPRLLTKWIARFPITKAAWDLKYPGVVPPGTDPTGAILYGDWRYYESQFSTSGVPPYIVGGKYHKITSNSVNDDTDIVVTRYADVLLLKALVENRVGSATEAMNLMNLVRKSRGLPNVPATDVDVNDKTAMENYILDERQFELFAEGDRWWDLLRTQKAVQVMNPINGQTDAKLYWPVYFVHMNDNPKLTQTDGYN